MNFARPGSQPLQHRSPRTAAPLLIAAFLALSHWCATPLLAADPLPSWNHGPARSALVRFVDRVTQANSPDFVPPAERIAVFDNDGTLWAEQPMYFQVAFALDRLKELAPQHPEWKTQDPFRHLLSPASKAPPMTEKDLLGIVMATHAGLTTDEFASAVETWITTARHPKTGHSYTAMVYQPMLEVLAFLRDRGFKTFIVSGGGIEFMRVFSEKVYGIPPEQVIGSSIKTRYEPRDGRPALVRLPEIDFIDDKAGKPVGIHRHIGRRPLMAFGNSDGDFEMLEWTTTGPGPRFGMLIHHTDPDREWAYDRESHIGQLKRGLDEAPRRGWLVTHMKQDWNRIFPGE